VQKDKRITAKHVREMQQAGMDRLSVPDDYLVGRILATNVVSTETGEVVSLANDEITEDRLKSCASRHRQDPDDLHERPRPGPLHRPDPEDRRDGRPERRAGGIYRMMRPGEPPPRRP